MPPHIADSPTPNGGTARLGVILSTYGEPTRNSLADQWMYSWRILRLLTRKIAKIPTPILPIISTVRAFQRVKAWKEANFLSPLEPLTDKTVTAVANLLRERGHADAELVVTRSYEFRRPLLTEILEGLRRDGCSRFLLVPMYLGGGDFTHGMSQFAIDDALGRLKWLKPEAIQMVTLMPEPRHLDAMADLTADFVLDQMRARGITLPARDWAACLAAHGSVQTPPPGVDNGVISFGELCWRIYKRLKPHVGVARNGWLNHTKGGRWTEPSVENLLPRLRKLGYQNLLYFPWGFSTDNAESALEGRQFCQAMEDPFPRVEHLPCLNDDARFVRFIADRIEEQTTGRAIIHGSTTRAHTPTRAVAIEVEA